VQKQVNATAL